MLQRLVSPNVIPTDSSFSIASEMKDPRKFGKAALIASGTITVVDILIGVVVYYYCGQYVASPSPGSAGPLMKKVTYGLALPGVVVSTVIFTHVRHSRRLLTADGRKVYVRPLSSWIVTLDQQYLAALGHLVLLYYRRLSCWIHRRIRHSHLQ